MARRVLGSEHPTIRYVFAVLVAGLVTVAAVAARPLIEVLPSPPFLLAVLLVAWVAGFGPAVVTCVVSILVIHYFFVTPLDSIVSLDPRELVGVPIFTAVALIMAWLATGRRRTEAERIESRGRENAARAEAERLARILRQAKLITDTPLREVSADRLIRELLSRVRDALSTDTATILLVTEDGAHLTPISSDRLREEVVEALQIPLGRGVAGLIALSEAGMTFPDLVETEVLSPFLRDRVKSLMGAPMRLGDRLIGVIHVGASTPHQFTEDDLHLLRVVADRVALVIDRARLYEAEVVARRAAEDANRAKDDFLAMLSHELRSPLNAITGWLNVIHAKPGDAALTARGLDTLERNTRLPTKLVDDVLDVSRIVAGRLEVTPQRVDVVPLVEAVLTSMRPTAVEKGVVLDSMLGASSRAVWGDPARLQQVIGNLVANAIKFTPARGSVEVRVQAGDSEVQIIVSDTGQGIAPEFLPHVFERFRQEDMSATRTYGGLGLGLAIVRHLIEAHGGTVRAESPGPGRGARFTVRLPVWKSGQATR